MSSSVPGSFNLIAQAASLSMLQTMHGYHAAAAAAGSLRPGGMPTPSYYLPQLRLPPQQTVAPAGSILNARLLGAPQPAPTAHFSCADTRPSAAAHSSMPAPTAMVPLPGGNSRQSEANNNSRHPLHHPISQHHRQPTPAPPIQTTGELVETTLEGKSIFAFDVGGEKRLCLPQVLNKVLLCAGATLTDINRVCEDLNIFCDRCNSQQMSVLKERKVFGPVLESCGLITKSNAERLCKSLLNSELPKFHGSPTDEDGIGVYHTCFGKQRGFLIPRLYTSSDAPCILCNGPNGCQALLSPAQFVGHAHTRQERETCHWGFDSTKWRLYLQLDKRLTDSPADGCLADSERACLEKVLESVKARFDRKRPQQSTSGVASGCPDSAKRFKIESNAESPAQPSTVSKFVVPLPPDVATGGAKLAPPHLRPGAASAAGTVLLSSSNCQEKLAAPIAAGATSGEQQQQRQTQTHRDYTPNVRLAPAAVNRSTSQVCSPAGASAAATAAVSAAAVAAAAERMEEDAASIEETIASDWESLTDWGEGHLPEKATPQFLAMVEKVKSGYRSHIDSLLGQLSGLRAQASRTVQLEAESAKMRRQLEEQGSPDVRRLRMKYMAQKEELRTLEEEKASLKLALSAAQGAAATSAASDQEEEIQQTAAEQESY